MKSINLLAELTLMGSGHFEYFLKPFFFKSESTKLAKINSLKVYWVFNYSVSLITLIVQTFFILNLRAQIVETVIFH